VVRVVPAHTRLSPDGIDFVRVSHQSILSSGFWAGTRAPVFPLLLLALRHHWGAVRVTQWLIGALCWGALALAAASKLRTLGGRVATFVGVLALSASLQLGVWDALVIAESLSLSLMALLLAAALVVPRRWSWAGVLGLAAVGTLFVLVRDTNALVAIVIAGVIAVAVALRRAPGRALVATGVLVAAAVAGALSSSAGDRWLQGLHHTVRDRVLVSRDATKWFVDRGLPDADLVRGPDGNDYTRGEVFWSDPRFDAYLQWLRHDGRRALATYALRHPSFLARDRFTRLADTVGPRPSVQSYRLFPKARPPLGSWLNDVVWPESPLVVWPLLGLGVAAGVAVVVVDPARSGVAAIGTACIVVGIGLAVLAANLDTAETPRHVIVQLAMTRLGALFAITAALEAAVVSRRGRR